MAPTVWETVTLRYWHGGRFQHMDSTGELIYVGGQGKTFQTLADELCYWEILEQAKKTGNYSTIQGVFYLIPGLGLLEGLRKVEDDTGVFEMGELAVKYRTVELYVLHNETGPSLTPRPQPQTTKHFQALNNAPQHDKPQKLTPRRAPPKVKDIPSRSSPRLNSVNFLGHSKPVGDNSKGEKALKESHSTTQPKSAPNANLPNAATLSQAPHPHSSTRVLKFNTPSNTKHTGPSQISQTQNTSAPSVSKLKAHIGTTQTQNNEPEGTQIDPLIDYDWTDPRPESPIPHSELFSSSGSDSDDPEYEPEPQSLTDLECETGDFEGEFEDEFEEEFEDDITEAQQLQAELNQYDSENSDEEYHLARERVRSCTSRLFEVAQQLQKEAAEGKLTTQQTRIKHPTTTVGEEEGYESEYFDSDQDIDTPPGSDEECEGRRSKRHLLVGSETDFSKFKWKVGQRFPTRADFKKAVAKYAIMQGRNVSIVVSNKARRQEIGVKCVKGCPFYLYSSWHSHKASFIVKTVREDHTCLRNMRKNRQLKTRWAARELLEVFKSRPHWPAAEIIQTIKRAYKVLVSKDFAYKTKYKAHQELHGSMQSHYKKVGRYIAALKAASPGTVLDLVVDSSKKTNPPIFQRLFTCFEGLVQGWKDGCRRIICVDAAFLKTFLGGQILSAVGRDPNEQMFPLAWAVVEGENNSSWEWFFSHIQACLQLGDGSGVAIVSDEHQVFLSPHFIFLDLLHVHAPTC